MIELLKELFPICRSITGEGVRKTLSVIKREINELEVFEIPTGQKCFDWIIPEEWEINSAYIIDPDGVKILDFKLNNLHIVNYSIGINQEMELEELQKHLHSIPEMPNAIPYVTSYYSKNWGFCLTHEQRLKLKRGKYKVFIDAKHFNGSLSYGEIILPGKSTKEVFISTYICHPSMANNELSGPIVTIELVKKLKLIKNRKYTYKIVFLPETIGSIAYLSRNLENMKKNIIAGFNLTCIGDERGYSYISTPYANTISDKIVAHVLKNIDTSYKTYSYLERGSDERQYCYPGIDLPVVTLMRTKFGEYPEYHTSLDNLNVVTDEGLQGGFNAIHLCIQILEKNCVFENLTLCEPQLGKRGLYPNTGTRNNKEIVKDMMNVLTYTNGKNSILEIAEIANITFEKVLSISNLLSDHKLLKIVEKSDD